MCHVSFEYETANISCLPCAEDFALFFPLRGKDILKIPFTPWADILTVYKIKTSIS